MERYIYIVIKDDQWLVSPLMKNIKEVIEKHKSTVEFVEYHPFKNDSEFSEDNYIDYLIRDNLYQRASISTYLDDRKSYQRPYIDLSR